MGLKLDQLPKHVQERLIRDNPAVFRPVEASQPKPTATQTLVGLRQKQQKSKRGLEVIVTLVALRHRPLDDDNNIGSLKPLRDACAQTIGIDDGDSRIKFEYGQSKTDGEEGVIVKVKYL